MTRGILTAQDLFEPTKTTVFFFDQLLGTIEEKGTELFQCSPVNQKAIPITGGKEKAIEYLLGAYNNKKKVQPAPINLNQTSLF